LNRKDLVNALGIVMPGVDNKGLAGITGGDSFVFDGQWIKTYNDSVAVSYPFETGISCTVKADKLYQSLNKMKGDEISLELGDNVLTVKCGITTLSAPVFEDSNVNQKIVDNLTLEGVEWKDLPKGFIEGLKSSIFSVSSNTAYGSLCGVCFESSNILSSDNFRATWSIISEMVDGFLLPSTSAKELLKLNGLEKYFVTDSWVHFMSDKGVIFSVRLWSNDFPVDRIKELFPTKEIGSKYIFPEELVESINRVSNLSYEDDGFNAYGGSVKLTRVKDNLIVKGEKGGFKIEDKIKIDKKTFPAKFDVMLPYESLKDILNRTREFYLCENFIYFEMENFKHIMAVNFEGE